MGRQRAGPLSPGLQHRGARRRGGGRTRRSRKSDWWDWQKIKRSPWKVSQESLKREDVDIGVEANGGSSKLRTETQPLHLARELLHW